jgi:AAA+ ATPase superfamily predicted ATPase
VRDKDSIYYIAARKSETQQAVEFSDEMEAIHAHATPLVFDSWSNALRMLVDECRGRKKKLVVVLDEFSQIESQNEAVPSELNAIVEKAGRDAEIMIVLCGSAVSQMERLAAPDQPLYRRFNQQLQLRPFRFEEAMLFLPDRSFEKIVEAYSLLGGMPMYLSEAARYRSLDKFLSEEVLNSKGLFFGEGDVLVAQEVRGSMYPAILEAIAFGNTRITEIGAVVGEERNSLSPYLRKLEALDLIAKEVPVTEANPAKSKRGIYLIKDNFLKFWYSYVNRHRARIEAEDPQILRYVKRDVSTEVGHGAEAVFRRALEIMNQKGELPVDLDRVGRYWDRRVYDLDACGVGVEKGVFLWGDCKWKNSTMGLGDYENFRQRVDMSGVNPRGENHFILLSRAGFDKGLLDLARTDGALTLDSNALERVFR